MERDERRRADALDRYWDAVQRGEQRSPSGQIDEFAAAVVARVNEGHTRPNIDTYQRSVRLRILEPIAPREQMVPPIARPDFRHPDEEPERPAWRSWLMPVAAVLALLLIAAGYFVYGRDDDDHRTTIPAAVASPSPQPPAEETVLTVTYPADEMPAGEASGGLAFWTIPVGNRSTWTPSCCPGPMIEYVVEGSYSVRAEAPITVVREDGTVETIPAGTEVTLLAGDSLLSRNETAVEAWNSGTVPTILLGWVHIIVDDPSYGGHYLPGWISGMQDVQMDAALPPGPATLTIQRVRVPAGSEIAANPDGLLFVLPYPDEGFYITRNSDGSYIIPGAQGGRESFTAFVLTVNPDAIAGTPTAASPEATPIR